MGNLLWIGYRPDTTPGRVTGSGSHFFLPIRVIMTAKHYLTAGDGAVVLRQLVEEQHLLLSQLQALLLDQVHLLLGFQGLLGHHEVLLQHALLLLPPLSPRVLNLGGL